MYRYKNDFFTLCHSKIDKENLHNRRFYSLAALQEFFLIPQIDPLFMSPNFAFFLKFNFAIRSMCLGVIFKKICYCFDLYVLCSI